MSRTVRQVRSIANGNGGVQPMDASDPPRPAANGNASSYAPRGQSLKDIGSEISVIKVSSNSTTKKIAAAMAHTVRLGKSVDITGFNIGCVSTILKAAAVGREYLKRDAKDAQLSIEHRVDEDNHKALYFTLHPLTVRVPECEDVTEYRVTVNTEAHKLAGALKARIEEKKGVVLFCIGPSSLFRAATAVALCSQYLEQKVYILNSFKKVQGRVETGELNGVEMRIVTV